MEKTGNSEVIKLTEEQKSEYKKLRRQINEAYLKMYNWNHGIGTRKLSVTPNLYNNRVERMKILLTSFGGGYLQNKYMFYGPIK